MVVMMVVFEKLFTTVYMTLESLNFLVLDYVYAHFT